jgi:hypothetical protein
LLRLTVLRTTVPSMKVTVPVGVPEPGDTGSTVAVKVTAWPKTDDAFEEVRFVVVLSWLTFNVRTPEVLPRKLLSPP